MAEYEEHPHPTEFVCVDEYPDYVTGQAEQRGGSHFFFVLTDCSDHQTTGHCPPYTENRELACVVCSK